MRKIHLLALASAITLATASPGGAQQLQYLGGPVVSSPQVVMVEYGGSQESYDSSLTDTMPRFLSAVVTNPSSYLGVLSEYNTVGLPGSLNQIIGPGLFLGSARIVPAAANAPVAVPGTTEPVAFWSNIAAETDAQIAAGKVPATETDAKGQPISVYLVFLPTGVQLRLAAAPPRQVCGFHGVTPNGALVGVISGSSACLQPSLPWQVLTIMASRELADTITDPKPGSNLQGWSDPQGTHPGNEAASACSGTGEVVPVNASVDLGQTAQIDMGWSQFVVQKLWSNRRAACVSSPPQPAADFRITPGSSTATVTPGSRTAVSIGFPVPAGSPALLLNVFVPTELAGISATVVPSHVSSGGTATLIISASGGAQVGSSTLTIVATTNSAGGTLEHGAPITLNVAVGRFSMSVTPTSGTVQGGGSTTLTVSTSLVGGTGNLIELTASDLPAGLSARFAPPLVAPGQSSTLTLTGDSALAFSPSVTFNVTGNNGQMIQTETVTLETFSGGGGAGSIGATGATGAQGPAGLQGPVGPQGPIGPMGPQGIQGPAGPQGSKGDTGATGPQGATGATGPQGAVGAKGDPGADGQQGPAGPTGATGAQGPTGPAGTLNGIVIQDNPISPSFIAGDITDNSVSTTAFGSVIGGGGSSLLPNTIFPQAPFIALTFATIAGGSGNTVTNTDGTISGGESNTVSGTGATVGGGLVNAAAGHGAVVPGGAGNSALGATSFAAGAHATAAHDGSFVWGDGSTTNTVQSTRPNQFMIRAAGGVAINNPNPLGGDSLAALDVGGSVRATTFFGDGSNLTGIIGTPGPQGPKGDIGPAGPAGATGPQGPAGTLGGIVIQVNPTFPDSPSLIAGNVTSNDSTRNLVEPYVWASSITGGGSNQIRNDSPTPSLSFATIGGGNSNRVGQTYGVIGGGTSNIVDGFYGGVGSVIAGGRANAINGSSAQWPLSATDSFIGGGHGNHVNVDNGAIAGGDNNGVQGAYSFVGGGQGNNAGQAATVTATGLVNYSYAFVGGGQNNDAAGVGSMIPGGTSNNAFGTNSFAAGALATAMHDGSFIWGDMSARPSQVVTTRPNQFMIQAAGGVAINNANPLSGAALDVGGIVRATQFILADGSPLTGATGPAGPTGPAGETGPRGPAAPIADGPCWSDTQRYVDCGNGTVTDQVTGLIWLKNPSCLLSGTGPNFSTANRVAQQMSEGYCGLSDHSTSGQWRLPTKEEWMATVARALAIGCGPLDGGISLTDDSGTTCYSNGPHTLTPFTVIGSVITRFWTSSTDEVTPTSAWFSDLASGIVGPGSKIATDTYVWTVRTGTR